MSHRMSKLNLNENEDNNSLDVSLTLFDPIFTEYDLEIIFQSQERREKRREERREKKRRSRSRNPESRNKDVPADDLEALIKGNLGILISHRSNSSPPIISF